MIVFTILVTLVIPLYGKTNPPTPVLNRAVVDIQCSDMTFTCAGPVYTVDIVAGDLTSVAYGVTIWYITNWGASGKFMVTTPSSGLFTVSPPLNGRSDDIIVSAQSGYDNGWSRSNVVLDCTEPHWKLNSSACSAVGSISYNFKVTATSNAVTGTYTITFTQDFTTE
jgi:hypothetical protein